MKIILAILILALLQYRLWFDNGNWIEVSRLEDQVQRQQQQNKNLEERNAALLAEVMDLKEGLDAIEELARSEMGMIKDDETFYQIIDYCRLSGSGRLVQGRHGGLFGYHSGGGHRGAYAVRPAQAVYFDKQ